MTAIQDSVVVLKFDAGQVTVESQDEDRFVMKAQDAVRACQDHQKVSQAIHLFKQDLLKPVREWCERRAADVKACYIPRKAGGVEIYVISTSPVYNFPLGRGVAELELDLADRGWEVSTMMIPDSPPEDLASHFNLNGALQVYGERESAPR